MDNLIVSPRVGVELREDLKQTEREHEFLVLRDELELTEGKHEVTDERV